MNYEKLMAKKNDDGKDAVDLLNEASEFMDKDRFKNAIALLTEAIGLCGHPRFYFNRGYCYHQLKDKKNAIKDFTKCLANDRGNDLQDHEKQRLYLYHGIIYEEMGEDEKAAENFKKAADWGYAGAITRLEKMGIDYTPNSKDEDSESEDKTDSSQKQQAQNTQQNTQQKQKEQSAKEFQKIYPIKKNKMKMSELVLPTIVGFIIGVVLIIIVSNLPKDETERTAVKKPPKVTAIVISDATQLRSEPSNTSYILRILKNGNIVEVKGDTSGEWINVEYESTEGWVNSDYIELKK